MILSVAATEVHVCTDVAASPCLPSSCTRQAPSQRTMVRAIFTLRAGGIALGGFGVALDPQRKVSHI